jgi:uncharacterized protein YbaP (TraB family)
MKRAIYIFLFTIGLFSCAKAQTGHGLCWKVSGNGLKKHCYLYGTMHVSDQRVFLWTDAAKSAFAKSKRVYTELPEDEIGSPLELLASLILPDSLSLPNILDSVDYSMVHQYFSDELSVPLEPFHRFPPLFVMMMLDPSAGSMAGDEDAENYLDRYIYLEAKKKGKKTDGIETLKEQMSVFTAISVNKQAFWLVEAVRQYLSDENFIDRESNVLLEDYLKGDLEALYQKYVVQNSVFFPHEFIEVFIIERNHNMANRAEVLYRKYGKTFIAVGALHLPGPDGVIALLRKKGYQVEPYIQVD